MFANPGSKERATMLCKHICSSNFLSNIEMCVHLKNKSINKTELHKCLIWMDYEYDGQRPVVICAVNRPTGLCTLLLCICKLQQESGAVNPGLTPLPLRIIQGQTAHIC